MGYPRLKNEFVKDKPVIYFSALKFNGNDNLEALSKTIFVYTHPETAAAVSFSSFESVFSEITRIAKQDRVVFVVNCNTHAV